MAREKLERRSKGACVQGIRSRKATASRYERVYRATLNRALDWADQFFVAKDPFSFNAFASIFPIALNYCFWFFLVCWSAGSSGRFGAAQLLPQSAALWERLSIVVLFLIALCYLWVTKKFWKRVYAREDLRSIIFARFGRLPDEWALPLPPIWYIVLVLLIFSISSIAASHLFSIHELKIWAFAFPVYGSLVILSAGLIMCRPTKSLTVVDLQLMKIGVFATLALMTLPFFGILLLVGVSESRLPYVASLLLFCFALPSACAASDFIAWGIARYLGRKLVAQPGTGSLGLQLVANSAAAIFCTMACVALLILALHLVAGMCERQRGVSPFDIGTVISTMEMTATGVDTVWLLGPLLTTMVPVSVHMVAVLAGFVTVLTPRRLRTAVSERIKGDPPSAQLTLPALYMAAVPWVSVGFLLLLVSAIARLLDFSHLGLVQQLIRFAHGVHYSLASYPQVIAAIGVIIVAIYWVSLPRKNVPPQNKETKMPGPTSSSPPTAKRKRKSSRRRRR